MYLVYLEDNSVFDCGTLHNSKWNEIPDKPITKLVYFIGGRKITLENYEQYNHLLERTKILNKEGLERITKVILLGKKGNKIDRIIFNLIENKIKPEEVDWRKEYYDSPTTGWKNGTVGTTGTWKVEKY